MRFGTLSRKALTGALRVVCVELEEELEPGDSVVLGTDVKGEPTRRAPSSVADPGNPLANVRDLYHVGRATDGWFDVRRLDGPRDRRVLHREAPVRRPLAGTLRVLPDPA